MQPNLKLLQLRELLAERFPGLKTRVEEMSVKNRATWPTGVRQCDALLHGGLPKGAMTELVGEKSGSGTALLIHSLLRRAHETNQFIALIDGRDSFDPTTIDQEILSRLLWLRCHNAAEAMKSADILLRDRNLPLVILDLKLNPAKELEKISSITWYRLQRVIEQTSTAVLIITPRTMVSSAEARLLLENRFELEDLERSQAELLENFSAKRDHERTTAETITQSA